jgi:hypothetical protein
MIDYPKSKMRTMDFIRIHLIGLIRLKAREIKFKKTLVKNYENFIWFNEPIIVDSKRIDRINELFAFYEDEIINIEWSQLSGKNLETILLILKNGKYK